VVNDFVAGGLEPLDDTGGAQSPGRFFASEGKGGGAGRRAYQGNLLRLTDDFDRQGRLLVLNFPADARVFP
jgi:hypothetical protein